MELKYRTAPAALDTENEGRLKAAFSVFDEIDSDQDIVRKSAFTDGQPVPLVWSHDWDKPIGKGVVKVENNHAVFDGQFFTDTANGMDAYRTVKAMGELQEFSFGFEVKESKRIKHQDQDAREITKITLFEVSPVLVGANRNTHLIGIKASKQATGSYEDVIARLSAAVHARYAGGYGMAYAYTEATYPDSVVVCVHNEAGREYYQLSYTIGSDGGVTFGEPQRMDQTYVPAETRGMTFEGQTSATLVMVRSTTERARSLADLRAKEGRALSGSRRTRLEQMRDVLSNGLEELNRLLEETTPRSADEESEGDGAKQIRRIEADQLALLARALGVEV